MLAIKGQSEDQGLHMKTGIHLFHTLLKHHIICYNRGPSQEHPRRYQGKAFLPCDGTSFYMSEPTFVSIKTSTAIPSSLI